MAVFDGFRHFIGMLKVVEENGIITVSGVPTETIQRDISKIWSTGKLGNYMFTATSKHSFSFPSFFAVEVIYLLTELMENRRAWTAQRPLVRIVEELRAHTWLQSTISETLQPRVDFSKLQRIKRRGLPHQLQFLETYNRYTQQYNLNGYILSAAPGAGKTQSLLMLGCCLGVDHHLIVSPKNAVYDVWRKEILMLVNGASVWIESDKRPYNGEEFIVCHYEALENVTDVARRLVGKRVMVTLDESHNLNELTSKRTLLFIQLCKLLDAKDVVWSSGTPLKALGYEIIPILRTIDPLFTPDSESRFRHIFGRNANRGLDILKHRIGLISYKVMKEQFRPEKPTEMDVKITLKGSNRYTVEAVKQEMRVYIEETMKMFKPKLDEYTRFFDQCVALAANAATTTSQKKAHALYLTYLKEIKKGFDSFTMGSMAKYCNVYEQTVIFPLLSKTDRDHFKDVRSAVKYLHLKVMGMALGNVLGKARVNCHLEMVDEIDFTHWIEKADSKTVIFTSYVEVLKKIQRKLEAAGFRPVVVYGATNKDLNQLLDQFRDDDTANPCLATYKSLSTAVPLISASTTLFIDQPFRDYVKTQAKARTDRLGQLHPVRFVNTLLDTGVEPNISTRSNDILEWSKAQVLAIFGDEGNAVEIETVDKYYEGMEAYRNQEPFPGRIALEALESALDEYF